MDWHLSETGEVFRELHSSPRGLSSVEAGKRLSEAGPNALREKKKRPLFILFLKQFNDFMILVLMAAALISGVVGEPEDTIAIMVIVLLNAAIGFVQEYRAEKAMEALKKMAEPMATLIRDGAAISCPSSGIVPGDIVVLDAGRIIPADMRLFEAARLKVDEAALTGESLPVEKVITALPDPGRALADRRNMVYKGTLVVHGRGLGLVVATGMETELGRIAAMLQEEKEVRTPLQKKLDGFGRRLAAAILVICGVVFGFGLLRGEPPLMMLLTAISLAVAAIPEALPAVITITLALGARKMVRQNALIRKLPAVETLGSVTYICSDKTGTLTMNRMKVEQIYVDGKIREAPDLGSGPGRDPSAGPLAMLLTALALNNDAQPDSGDRLIGDPTEIALCRFARENGFDKKTLERAYPRVEEIPFDSGRKCMTTFHRWEGREVLSLTKGAVETLVEKAGHILTSEGLKPVSKQEMVHAAELMAARGLRVLAVAMRRWDALPEPVSPGGCESGLTLVGLAGMMDPPREEAGEAVAMCRTAGIRPVMITGDHPLTARAIAGRLGILKDDSDDVMTGMELDALTGEAFEKRVEQLKVYARVAPEQKLKIVKALQGKGQFVAMTGDGVNDAPALKRADIGIAMGMIGTDVAREASDMILLDDNFATIVKSVKEGRRIYDNIRKFIRYLLSTNSGEVWTLFLAPFLGLPLPLLPLQILWVNLMTDGLPALALSVEPEEGDVMKRPPRDPGENFFARGLGLSVLWVGLFIGAAALSVQALSLHAGNPKWQTMVFTVLCLSQLANVLAVRSEKQSLFTIGLFSNRFLLVAVALSFVLQMAVIYLPPLNPVFRTVPLSASELLAAILFSSLVFFAVETEKWVRRRVKPRNSDRCF